MFLEIGIFNPQLLSIISPGPLSLNITGKECDSASTTAVPQNHENWEKQTHREIYTLMNFLCSIKPTIFIFFSNP